MRAPLKTALTNWAPSINIVIIIIIIAIVIIIINDLSPSLNNAVIFAHFQTTGNIWI